MDVVELTEETRLESNSEMPPCYVPIYDLGNGELFCLKASKKPNAKEVPIVVWDPGAEFDLDDSEAGKFKETIIEKDFGTFLLKWVAAKATSKPSPKGKPIKSRGKKK